MGFVCWVLCGLVPCCCVVEAQSFVRHGNKSACDLIRINYYSMNMNITDCLTDNFGMSYYKINKPMSWLEAQLWCGVGFSEGCTGLGVSYDQNNFRILAEMARSSAVPNKTNSESSNGCWIGVRKLHKQKVCTDTSEYARKKRHEETHKSDKNWPPKFTQTPPCQVEDGAIRERTTCGYVVWDDLQRYRIRDECCGRKLRALCMKKIPKDSFSTNPTQNDQMIDT